VGSGKGGRLAVFRNRDGRLAPAAAGPVAPEDLTTVLGLASPGGARLLVGIASWEGRSEEELGRNPAVAAVRLGRHGAAGPLEPLLGSTEASIGPLALGDYSGDGLPDLFVGGRVIPLAYPVAASSALFRNAGGRFVLDTVNTRLLEGIGLVSAAMFADLNGDGLPDLVLAREWGGLALFLNLGQGRLAPAPPSVGLEGWTSRWNGIAAGDLDGDGRLDLVATSWGRNTMLPADSANPLVIAYGRFGARGEVETLLAQYDPGIGRLAPLDEFPRIRLAAPAIAGRFPTFAAYAGASLDQILGAVPVRTDRLEARTLDHMVFLNRGDHFEPRPLPGAAQLAPAFSAGVADFDGDGHEDVFLAQNFSYTVAGAPRYDAGRGLLLRGDGQGGLVPMTGAASGLVIYGDQRGAGYADYDHDGRWDLAVSQNGAATRLFHNRGARPGLRVRLIGPPGNADALGAQIRVGFGGRLGPVREVQAGAGYWSQNGAVQVFGLSGTPTEVWVRWPGGDVTRVPVPEGAREVTIRR
jgi:hypothetical protein